MNIYKEFKNPSSKYRPIPFWYWNDIREEKFTPVLVEEQIKELNQKGFGGFVIFNKPNNYTEERFGFSTDDYLGEKWFDMCRIAIEKGASLGMEVWINDGFDYPPGGIGGRMKRLVPQAYQRELVFNENSSPPAPSDDIISIVKNGNTFFTVSVKEPDRPEGFLNRFPAFLDPEANSIFIAEVYEKYKYMLGDLFGNKLVGFFGDCDARRATHFPWARNFGTRFEDKFGYSIEKHLPSLWVDMPESQKTRYDYYSFISELYSSWFKNCYVWCKNNDLKYMYHTSDTGPASIIPNSDVYCNRSSYFIEGRFSEVNSYCDYVGTDHELMALNGGLHFDFTFKGKIADWNPEPLVWGKSKKRADFERILTENKTYGDVRAKLASSLARTKSKLGAVCEAYAACNNSATLEDLKWIADWLISQGITKFIPQACLYSYEGYRKVVYTPNHFRQSHLWYNYKDFTDYIGRATSILSAGEHIGEIAVLEPSKSLWANKKFNPLIFFDTLDLLNHSPWDYTVISEEDLSNNKNYKILILTGITDISQESIQHINDFDNIINLSSSLIIPDSLYIEHKSFNNDFIQTKNPLLTKIEEILEPDVTIFENGRRISTVHFTHRKTKDCDIYFLVNLEGENTTKIIVNLPYSGHKPKIWNPVDGQKFAIRHTVITNRMEIELDLPFKSSIFVVVPKEKDYLLESLPAKKTIEKLKNWTIEPENKNILPIPSLYKTFEFDSQVTKCQLLLPNILNGFLNEELVSDFATGEEIIFDCRYLICNIPLIQGKNKLVFNDIGDLIDYRNVYLRGDFLVDIKTSGNKIDYKNWYHFRNCILSETKVTLLEHNKFLTLGDWSKQGYPFYSGVVKYTANFNIDSLNKDKQYFLSLKKLHGSGKVSVNNISCGTINFSPYELNISNAVFSGNNKLVISIRNTDANILEEYPEQSGIDDVFLAIRSRY